MSCSSNTPVYQYIFKKNYIFFILASIWKTINFKYTKSQNRKSIMFLTEISPIFINICLTSLVQVHWELLALSCQLTKNTIFPLLVLADKQPNPKR